MVELSPELPRALPRMFRLQAKSCAHVPLYLALFEALADLAEADLGAFDLLLVEWASRSFGTFYGATLLLAASLHRAFLEGDPAIDPVRGDFEAAVASSPGAAPSAGLAERVARVLRSPSPRMREFWRTGTVQTNEVTRSIAWRLVADLVADVIGGPIVLVELGCSAGLNLVRRDLGLTWTGWAPRRQPLVVAALGVDRRPLDVRSAEDRLLLRASLWPGQTDRRARLDAAIDSLTSELERGGSTSLVQGELPAAVDLVEPFAARHEGAFLLVFSTIVTGYLTDAAYAELQARLGALLGARPGAWVELETPRGRPDAADRAELAV